MAFFAAPAMNGGEVLTMAPAYGSPVIDAGPDDAVCAAPYDARGTVRPLDGEFPFQWPIRDWRDQSLDRARDQQEEGRSGDQHDGATPILPERAPTGSPAGNENRGVLRSSATIPSQFGHHSPPTPNCRTAS